MSFYKKQYIDDGVTRTHFRLPENKLLDYSRLRLLLNRYDASGHKIPVNLRFVTLQGELVEWENVVVSSRNERARTHNFISTVSHNVRTVKDCLILSVNDVKIVIH